MEIYELRYFLGVAKFENIHRASEKLNVSPASLSKAVGRLESELGVRLFQRERRNIRLTEQGRLLQRRASHLVQLEESARMELSGQGAVRAVIAGPEILLAKLGTAQAEAIRQRHPGARFEFQALTEAEAAARVLQGDAHLALTTGDTPDGLTAKSICEAKFKTYAGKGHPLFAAAKAGRMVDVAEVLKHAFASPDHALLGKVGAKQSLDGWRDDQFPRNLEYLTSSLKILEELVVGGSALAYLPEYYGDDLPVETLKISGCPYSCVQKIKLLARRPKETGWLNLIF
jgi:DNA-binding transcriptional LysR family regulator